MAKPQTPVNQTNIQADPVVSVQEKQIEQRFAEAPIVNNKLSELGTMVLNGVKQYCVDMDPLQSQTNQTGARHQLALFRMFQLLVDKIPENEFETVMLEVLAVVRQHRNGVFSSRFAGRFADTIPLDTKERNSFFAFMNLLSISIDVRARQLVSKQFDFHRALIGGFTEDGCNRLEQFYTA